MGRYARIVAVAVAVAASWLGVGCKPKVEDGPKKREPLGPGYLAESPTEGEIGPTNADGQAVTPAVTQEFSKPPATNDWWSSLIWKHSDPRSVELFPHPASMRAEPRGLQIGYPRDPDVSDTAFFYPHRADLVFSVTGIQDAAVSVADYGDWTVRARFSQGDAAFDATMGHGLPFVYVDGIRGRPEVHVGSETLPARVLLNEGGTLAVEVGNRAYGLFAPSGSSWRLEGGVARVDLAGRDFMSVAVLPDNEAATIARFAGHAHLHVVGSEVSWDYDPAKGAVTATYALKTELRRGDPVQPEATPSTASTPVGPAGNGPADAGPPATDPPAAPPDDPPGVATPTSPLMALYPHQWKRHTGSYLPFEYASARGTMKVIAADRFSTTHPAGGILPVLPNVGAAKSRRLKSLIKLVSNADLFPPGLEYTRDSYWEGKSFGRLCQLVQIADQIGETKLRDRMLDGMKAELADWFDGRAPRYFHYFKPWRTMIGVPTMYQSGALLNDHHFHYGYYIMAAAIIGRYDRGWAEKWAPVVEKLIKDAGNWDRSDTEFPFLRHFDPYAGHSWATGTTMSNQGNNEESSSEDINFATSLVLWGEIMERPTIRDTGLYMHATLVDTIEQYWYDVDQDNYPEGFNHPAVGIVWGSGGAYTTWFNPMSPFIHGIQLTPTHGGSLWLGRRRDNIRRVLEHNREQYESEVLLWRDLFWMLEAFDDPQRASNRFSEEHFFNPEWGNSMAHAHHFIENMTALGHVRADITGDVPLSAVFQRDERITHVAYNASSKPRVVKFTDGASLEVPSRRMAWSESKRADPPSN